MKISKYAGMNSAKYFTVIDEKIGSGECILGYEADEGFKRKYYRIVGWNDCITIPTFTKAKALVRNVTKLPSWRGMTGLTSVVGHEIDPKVVKVEKRKDGRIYDIYGHGELVATVNGVPNSRKATITYTSGFMPAPEKSVNRAIFVVICYITKGQRLLWEDGDDTE